MSILVLQTAPRQRLRARDPGAEAPAAPRPGADIAYVLSGDGREVAAHGTCAAALLPRADSVVLALADADVAWHRIVLPKAPAARLRAALAGVLEEMLLEDPAQVQLAVAPGAVAGGSAWIAAIDRDWLRAELAALEAAQVFVDRIVPSSWPDDPPAGHFLVPAVGGGGSGGDGALALVWSHADGVTPLALQGGLARALLPQPAPDGTRWTATPDAAAAAECWLGEPVAVLPAAERALQAARSLWNLRQFDLARKSRGTRALGDALRVFLSPPWRPLRYALAALAATQIVGLNLWAWRLDAAVEARRAAQVGLLQTTHPQVRAVLDAPLQMRREAVALRAAAGQPDDGDLEPLLAQAAAAWPPERPPVESLRFEPGRLTLAAAGWDAAQIERFRGQLRTAGVQVDSVDGRLVLSAAESGPGRGGAR